MTETPHNHNNEGCLLTKRQKGCKQKLIEEKKLIITKKKKAGKIVAVDLTKNILGIYIYICAFGALDLLLCYC